MLSTLPGFEAAFRRHFDSVYRYLARRVGDSLAEDLAAQTFLEAFRGRARFDGRSASARSWLFGIASNLLRHHYRSETRYWAAVSRTRQTGLSGEEDLDDAVRRADLSGHGAAVAAALARLSGDERDVLLLFAWEQLSYLEIASALAVPVGTVRSRLSRARKILRSELDAVWKSEVQDG